MVTESTTRLLLVRSGGRCAGCYRELLVSQLTWKSAYLGERAHIVGRTATAGSPRGENSLHVEQRDDPNNLILLCGDCHREVDAKPNLDEITVEWLRCLKHLHESRIEQLLAVPPDRETAVLRMHGMIGEGQVHINRAAVAAAVLKQDRVARFPLNHDRAGIEVDLRQIPSPNPGDRRYYATCRERIDRVFEQQVAPAVESGTLRHVSVFALARWPLLVYLGARLGDRLDTDVYQRHRSTELWSWPTGAVHSQFGWELVAAGEQSSDGVLVLSVSASVNESEVPECLEDLPVYRVSPVREATPHYDIVGSPEALKSAEKALRDVLADIEQHRKHIRSLHVLGAAPVSVCVTLGRVLTRGIHPKLVLYDRVNGQYQPAMEII